MRNDEHFQFHFEFRRMVNRFGAENLKVELLFESYLIVFEQEDEALKKIVKSAYTAQIQESDKQRGDIFIGMKGAVRASIKHFNPAVQEAGKRLKIVFGTYGNITRKAYNEQTSAMYNMLQELRGKYAIDATLTGIDVWADELEIRNNQFAELMRGRFEESAEKTDLKLKKVRPKVDGAYEAIVEKINSLMVVEGNGMYEPFVRLLNEVIKKYDMTMATRAKKKAGSRPDEVEPQS